VALAWAFGGILLGAGVLLFVAAHWDELSPAERFALVLGMVALSHVGGALLASRIAPLATVLHAVGTLALGAGIFLAGQIFNLEEHWPGGILLWALGALIAWAVLGDWAQATLLALLTPTWLHGEWIVATEYYRGHDLILASGLTLLSVVYFSARTKQADSPVRRALMWLGGLALIPCTFWLSLQREHWWSWQPGADIPANLQLVGWVMAIGLPLAAGNALRGRITWQPFAVAAWVALLGSTTRVHGFKNAFAQAWGELGSYLLCGLFSMALVWWGLQEARRERINMGIAGFGLTVLCFYFATVMDKLGRSLSLMGLGLLFLGLGFGLRRARTQLLARLEATERQAQP